MNNAREVLAAMPKVLSRAAVSRLGVVQKGLEILDWILYDTLDITAAGTQDTYTFFQQAIGQAGITKETTNLEIASQLPADHVFVTQKIVIEALPALAASGGEDPQYLQDALKMTHEGFGIFNIGNRAYFEAPIKTYIGGNLQGFAALDAQGAARASVYAQTRAIINAELEYSPVIPSTYNFNWVAKYPVKPTVSVDARLRCNFVGKIIRPVQG